MQFLKTLFWVLLAVLAVVFANTNWTFVTIRLWSGLSADVNLPLLLLAVFLLGFVPMLLVMQATRWRLRTRLASAERQLADLRAPVVMPTEAEEVSVPPASVMTAVPPGVA